MTEATVFTAKANGPDPVPFLAALIVAPLMIGAPSAAMIYLLSLMSEPPGLIMILLVFPVVATGLGAPTYLLLGGPAFWVSLKNGHSIAPIAFVTNLASLPLVALAFAVMGGDPMTALAMFGVLGSVFAPLWGAIFQSLYERFSGEKTDV